MYSKQELEIYAEGLTYASVCTSLSKEAAETAMQQENDAGTANNWKLSEEDFADGTKNGVDCPHKSGFKHYLMVC